MATACRLPLAASFLAAPGGSTYASRLYPREAAESPPRGESDGGSGAPKSLHEHSNSTASQEAPDPGETGPDRSGTTWLRYTHLGIQYCLTLLLCVLAGQWLDERAQTQPWLTIVGALLGFGAATWLIVSATQRIRS